ncbi:class I SAM-dependent methyltransferase [Mycobacterium sp. CPCC 205372]|uniref:Class I SAM-dependent methyltransferase n=1 Tax=Mycobacterium hippophais TaxID=3016340 RepID=A0ABT4PVX8_9MYCO|nr:class I SAM-dependent methyltransferase [Mycobacterium hippophais]MCZ8380690.1 class I SAM-dependent methyltransferase [Mycobacterium hippophais]
MAETTVVNHHADHPGFAGPGGLLFAIALLLIGRPNARLAVELAEVSDADRVVDIGCGAGVAVRATARRGASATGVDPAPVMLRVARLVTRGSGKVGWAQGSAEQVPVPDASATVLWSLATVHHWKDVDAGLAEAHRVLQPGGRLLAVERRTSADATGLASHGWTGDQAEAFASLCRAAGFTDMSVTEHGHGRRGVWAVRGLRP